MRASSVSAPTFSARMTSVPAVFIVAPTTRAPGVLLDRDRLAGDHRFVDVAPPFDHDPVDRDLLARPDAQQVADPNLLERHVDLAAVGD